MEYNFLADLLNKYSQLTPWVQTALGLCVGCVILGLAYIVKGIVEALLMPFYRKRRQCFESMPLLEAQKVLPEETSHGLRERREASLGL